MAALPSASAAVKRIRVDFISVASPCSMRFGCRAGTRGIIKRAQSAGCYTSRVKRDRRKAAKALASEPRKAPRQFDRRHALLGGVLLLAVFAYSNSFRAPF